MTRLAPSPRTRWVTPILLCAACSTSPPVLDPLGDDPAFDFDGAALTDLSAQCVFAAGVVTFTLESGDIGVMSRSAAGDLLINGVPCDDATVSAVRQIHVEEGSEGPQTFVIDFLAGTFVNGRAAGPGWDLDLGAGSDDLRLRGSSGADRFTAGVDGIAINNDAYVDIEYAGAEALIVSLGPGNDVFSAGGSAATGAAMTSSITVYGGAGNDSLRGGDGDDTLYGGEGNDSFPSGAVADGADQLHGGDGRDTADYSARTASVSVTLDDVDDDGAPLEEDGVMSDVEDVVGSMGADLLVGSDEDNALTGGPGDDTLRGGDGDDTLSGGAGDDTFECGTSTDGADIFAGGAGIDTADFSGRTATLTISLDGRAGDGEDAEDDNVRADVERVVGGSGNDTITGSAARNELEGGDGDDTIAGGAGDDTLIGGEGDDLLRGDAGNDLFPCGTSTDGADVFEGGAGLDTVSYAERTSPLTVTIGDAADDGEDDELDDVGSTVENVRGGSDDDTIDGNALNNVIDGGDGDDVLGGGAGDDVISGGGGVDVLYGDAGDDTLDGEAGTDRIFCGSGHGDVVVDTTATGDVASCELSGPSTCSASVVAQAGDDATLRGNTSGGTRYDDVCPDGELMIGFDVQLGGSWDGAAVVCGEVALTCEAEGPFTLDLEAGTTLTQRGGNSSPVSARCGAGEVVVGMDVISGLLIDGVRLRCAPLDVTEAERLSLTLGEASAGTWVGSSGGTPASSDCASGEVARGAVLRAGNSLDAIGLKCGSPAVR